jgi:hypothetical protein
MLEPLLLRHEPSSLDQLFFLLLFSPALLVLLPIFESAAVGCCIYSAPSASKGVLVSLFRGLIPGLVRHVCALLEECWHAVKFGRRVLVRLSSSGARITTAAFGLWSGAQLQERGCM